MTIKLFLLIITSVCISAFAQISLKTGMSGPHIQSALDGDTSWGELFLPIFGNSYVLGGLVMYGLGAILWLLVLARLDVSMAYPFMGLGFILTMLLGFFLLGETISIFRVIGTLFVVAGVTLISAY